MGVPDSRGEARRKTTSCQDTDLHTTQQNIIMFTHEQTNEMENRCMLSYSRNIHLHKWKAKTHTKTKSLTHSRVYTSYIHNLGLPASCDFGENQNMQILFAYLQESTSTNVIENNLTATFTFSEMHMYYPHYNFRCSRSHAEQPERQFREVTFLTALPLPLLASTKPPRRCIRAEWPAVEVGMLATHNVPKTLTPIIAQRAIDDRTMFPASI